MEQMLMKRTTFTFSLEAFKTTVYPLLRANCSGCHSTQNKNGNGAQARFTPISIRAWRTSTC
jgi:hypothetical protein